MIGSPVYFVNCVHTVKNSKKHKKKPETRKQIRLKDNRTESLKMVREKIRVDS